MLFIFLLHILIQLGMWIFFKELIEKDPLVVFGEGEYGVTDILYAAARSKNSEVFRLLLDFALSLRCGFSSGGELEEQLGTINPDFGKLFKCCHPHFTYILHMLSFL